MSSPWKNLSIPEPLNLEVIMSEEAAKKNKKCLKATNAFHSNICEKLDTQDSCDLVSNAEITRISEKERAEGYIDSEDSEFDSDDEEIEVVDENNLQHSEKVISKCDVKLKPLGCKYIPEIRALPKNCAELDLKLLDKVSLQRLTAWGDIATAQLSLDMLTKLQLHKLINEKHLLERINGVISVGQEAIVLHANSDASYPNIALPKECAVKIYTETVGDSRQQESYVKNDKRFKERCGKQSRRRITMRLWAEREFQYLLRLYKAGIPCPQPIALIKNVLVTSFIGENHHPAPTLKSAMIDEIDENVKAYSQIIQSLKTMYNVVKLNHVNLSPDTNMLWHNKQCYFIDINQCEEVTPFKLSACQMDALYKTYHHIYMFFRFYCHRPLTTRSDILMEGTAAFKEITGKPYELDYSYFKFFK